jgi:hypothetical protein
MPACRPSFSGRCRGEAEVGREEKSADPAENDPTATSVVRRSSRGNADGRPYAAPVIAGANVSITDVLIHIIKLSDLTDPLTCGSIGRELTVAMPLSLKYVRWTDGFDRLVRHQSRKRGAWAGYSRTS